MHDCDAELASHGYRFVPGPSGQSHDFVLRKTSDESAGFTFEGPERFAALALTVFRWTKEKLTRFCDLEALSGFSSSAIPYATPGFADREAPVLLLLCGDVPGGDAGSWSRKLIINDGTLPGCMFEYILRAQARGWSVVVADLHAHNGTASPHAHLLELWQKLLGPSRLSKLLIVGHSYGGPCGVGLLKAVPDAVRNLHAFVGTDAMGWSAATGWRQDALDESVPAEAEVRSCVAVTGGDVEEAIKNRERCERYATTVPAAFQPAPPELAARLVEVGRNYVSSDLPMGAPCCVEPGKMIQLSAGAVDHGKTTSAAIDGVFAFLDEGAKGVAGTANAAVRAV